MIGRRFIKAGSTAWTAAALLLGGAVSAGESMTPAEIAQELRSFNTLGSVLYLAAHPDDENTEFIAWAARGRSYRTAYLSLTRGDGGQNELGGDFGEKLGVLRTQELLAARAIDGGRQFFTRAIDFGFSKNPEETLRIWNHREVLADVVRVIRTFRPDVIVTRFPIPPGSGGHGHHTASAMLAVEAFKLAGDPQSFPEQIAAGLAPWQPKRIFWNVFSWGRVDTQGLNGAAIELDIAGDDPVTGEALGTLANRSRGMHKTQGLGFFSARTAAASNVQRFLLLAGKPANEDLMDGVETTWKRVPGGEAIATASAQLLATFDSARPVASVPAILELRKQLAALPSDPLVDEKRAQLDRILQACLGLSIESVIENAEVVPGESLVVTHTGRLTADVPVRWRGRPLAPNQPVTVETTLTIPTDSPLSQPYWLREAPAEGIATVHDTSLIGRPENPPEFASRERFEIGEQSLEISTTPAALLADASGTTARVPLRVVAPVALTWLPPLELVAPGGSTEVTLGLTAIRANVSGTLQLTAPAGWSITPATQSFQLGAIGTETRMKFVVSAPAQPSSGHIAVRAEVGPRRYHRDRVELRYAHLPAQLLQPDATLAVASFDVKTRARRVGYVPGAGDDIPAALRLLGCEVTDIDLAKSSADDLRAFDAIVVGVRAFENAALREHLPTLLAYVERGGVAIVQYNRPHNVNTAALGPYPLSIQGSAPQQRVTNEDAPVTFLLPDHPALTTPNRITAADFTGWVQERGTYFPSSWDEDRYAALLAMSDPGEAPLRGSLLVARHGSGYYVYSGLAFFRQLPAGVPGAYRLFANLLSLGR